MIKKLILKIVFHPRIATIALKTSMKLHSFAYEMCGILSVIVNQGIHPKHRILKYKEWFLEKIPPNSVILDVGSNTGAMPILFSSKARTVYGIEIDSRLASIAKSNNTNSNVVFLTGDATSYDFSECEPIDCVTLSNVLEHIQDRIGLLNSLKHRLPWKNTKDRLFLIRVPAIDRDWLSVYKKELGIDYRLDSTHEIEYTREQLISELKIAGLQIVEFDVKFGEYYAVCLGK